MFTTYHQTSDQGLTWNGSDWVKPASLCMPFPSSNGGETRKVDMDAVTTANRQSIPKNPIQTYTEYHAKWTELCREQEKLIATSKQSTSREDHEDRTRQLQWYKYYADQSIRAAHFFYSRRQDKIETAPFDLPPAPPQYKHASTKTVRFFSEPHLPSNNDASASLRSALTMLSNSSSSNAVFNHSPVAGVGADSDSRKRLSDQINNNDFHERLTNHLSPPHVSSPAVDNDSSSRVSPITSVIPSTDPPPVSKRAKLDFDLQAFIDLVNKEQSSADMEATGAIVKGTCMTLEKEYEALTSFPDSEKVRPQAILEQHLSNLKELHEQKNGKDNNYTWVCSQLKAIRQDLMVQQLRKKNPFAINVYEFHARIALENHDLEEFNQCLTQLEDLYKDFTSLDEAVVQQRNEFISLRILFSSFMTLRNKNNASTELLFDLFTILKSLTAEQRNNSSVQFALHVREAVADRNFHRFFLLRQKVPTTSTADLLSLMLPYVKEDALNVTRKAYRPSESGDCHKRITVVS